MKIRLAENFRAIFYAPFYATQALGLYEREGVDIDFVGSSVPGNIATASRVSRRAGAPSPPRPSSIGRMSYAQRSSTVPG